jgi:hypothetical protein
LSCALARCHDISHSPWWSAGSLSQSLRTFRITSCARLSGLGWGRWKSNRDQGMQDYWFYTGSGALQLSRQSERPLPISGPQTFPQKSRPGTSLQKCECRSPDVTREKEKRKGGGKKKKKKTSVTFLPLGFRLFLFQLQINNKKTCSQLLSMFVSGSCACPSHLWISRVLTSSSSLGISSLFCRATQCMWVM